MCVSKANSVKAAETPETTNIFLRMADLFFVSHSSKNATTG